MRLCRLIRAEQGESAALTIQCRPQKTAEWSNYDQEHDRFRPGRIPAGAKEILRGDPRRVLKEYVERGKTDVYVTYEDTAGAGASIRYDESAAAAYLEHFRQMCARLGVKDDVTASVLGACPDVFVQEEEREDAEGNSVWKLEVSGYQPRNTVIEIKEEQTL